MRSHQGLRVLCTSPRLCALGKPLPTPGLGVFLGEARGLNSQGPDSAISRANINSKNGAGVGGAVTSLCQVEVFLKTSGSTKSREQPG